MNSAICSPISCCYSEYIFYGKYMYSWSWYLWKKKKHFFLNNVNWYFLLSIYAKSAALKEAIEDLEWPGSSIKITLEPDPPSVSLRAEGHGDLQVCIVFNSNDQMLVALKFKLTMYTFCFSDRLHVLCEFWTLGGISVWSLSFFQVFYFSFLKNYYFCVSCHFLASNFICYYYACC